MKYIIAFLLISSYHHYAHAATLQLKFINNDIRIIGEFSYQAKHPLTIQGFDKNDKPYTLVISAKPKASDLIELQYHLQHNNMNHNAAVSAQKGKLASVGTKTETKKESNIIFEAIVTE